jgi:hypothetical protein
LVCDGFGEKGFPCSRGTIEDYSFGWLDAHFFVEFRVGERELDGLLQRRKNIRPQDDRRDGITLISWIWFSRPPISA